MQEQNGNVTYTPTCQICDSQDGGLKFISYPFVVSIIVMTFQRAFTGTYCKKHRRRYHALASLITATVGWFGIPFGFILTPITLYKLALGGASAPEENSLIQIQLGNKKLLTGDTLGAIRCFEESLRFKDNYSVRQKLAGLYQFNRSEINYPNPAFQILGIPFFLLASGIIGVFIGIADSVISYLLNPLFGTNNSIFAAILSWMPFMVMMFFGILVIRSLLEWVLRILQVESNFLGASLASASAIAFSASILEAQLILRNISRISESFAYSSQDGIFALRSFAAYGGIQAIINSLKYGEIPGLIYFLLVATIWGLSIYIGALTSSELAHWHRLISQLREPTASEMGRTNNLAWIALGGTIVLSLFLIIFSYPGRFANIEEAYIHFEKGQIALDNYDYVTADQHFEAAADIWPESVQSHVNLGVGSASQQNFDLAYSELNMALDIEPKSLAANFIMGYLHIARGEFSDAVNNFKSVSLSQPNWGMPHAILAAIYYELDRNELIDQEISAALEREDGDAQTSAAIAEYYFAIQDFKEAEEHALTASKISNESRDYIFLARIYIYQTKLELAEEAIQAAHTPDASPVEIYLAEANLAEARYDLERARSILIEALEQFPDNSDLLDDLSFVYFQMGRLDDAIVQGEKAIAANPYNGPGYIDLAYAYQGQGKTARALEVAQRGAMLMPKYDRAHYILGLCYMDSGMKELAKKEFETFLTLYWERIYVKEDKDKAVEYLKQLK